MNEIPVSEKWNAARKVIPRGASSGHRLGFNQVFVKSKGAYLWDENGTEYLDFLNAWGPIVVGHSNDRINRSVYEAVSKCDLSGVGPQPGEIELGEKICRLMPCAEKVAFCTSGTDASMHATHIARAYTSRLKILKFHGSYHGWNDHVAVGGARAGLTKESKLNTVNSAGLHPAVTNDVVVVEWNDFAGLKAAFDQYGDELAGAFSEGYIHSFGCVPASPGFLELLRELCSKHGTVLIFDEVKTGFRASLGGIQKVVGVIPDLAIFGKAVANGYSLAGVAGKDEFMGQLGAYRQDSATIDGTYNASPYALAAANTTLDILESENVIEKIYALGERLRAGYKEAAADAGIDVVVPGIGSQWAVYFQSSTPKTFKDTLDSNTAQYAIYQQTLMQHGVLETTAPTGDRRLNASTTFEDIDRAIEVAHSAFKAAANV